MSYVHTLLGQRITWTVPQPSVFDPEIRRMVKQPPIERTGVVWSHGPVGDTAWVVPDEPCEDEGRAVCVHLSRKGHTARKVDLERSLFITQLAGIVAMRHRQHIPVSLFHGEGYGGYGYSLERGA